MPADAQYHQRAEAPRKQPPETHPHGRGEAERGGPGGVVDVLTAGGVGCFRGSAVAVDLVIFGGVRLGSNTQDQVYVSV